MIDLELRAKKLGKKPDTAKVTDETSFARQDELASDPFYLEQVYPDAAPLFLAHSVGSTNEKTVVVALDTNALLLPYQVKAGNVTEIGKVFNRLSSEKRLYIPGRVAREFAKHRDVQLANVIADLNKRKTILSGEMPPMLSAIPGYKAAESAYTELAKTHKAYVAALDELVGQIKGFRGDDPIMVEYAKVFNKDNIIDLPWDENTKKEYLKERDWRFRHKIPPGYKDANKEDGGIGDFLIWKSLLSLGQRKKMDLAFVTGEQKADWFIRSDGGSVYPRHELIDEYRRSSEGKCLRLMSLYELLGEMKVADDVVQDVKHAETQANTAVLLQRASAGTGLSAISTETGLRPLTFVADRTYLFWAPAKRIDQEGTQIRSMWSVTNVSDRNYFILDARLANYNASYVNIAVEDPMAGVYSAQYPIRAKHLIHLVANLFFFPAICRDGEKLTADVIFTDNFGEEHIVKAVQFRQMGTE